MIKVTNHIPTFPGVIVVQFSSTIVLTAGSKINTVKN